MENTLDIGDMSKYNSSSDKGHSGSTAQGLFIHEAVESYNFLKTPGSDKMNRDQKLALYFDHNGKLGVHSAGCSS